jgi:hypothetical protein
MTYALATDVSSNSPAWMQDSMIRLQRDLAAKYGDAQRPRISRGLHQLMEYWRPQDGDAATFEQFVTANFA